MQLVFGQDAILNIKHVSDLEHIRQHKQLQINHNNRRENMRRNNHQYKVGDKILVKHKEKSKHELEFMGPFPITQINDVSNIVNNYPWSGILAATMFAVRATYHTTLQAFPMQLVFGRDAILNIKHVANWEHIWQRKQLQINHNNKRNMRRNNHQYKVGEKF